MFVTSACTKKDPVPLSAQIYFQNDACMVTVEHFAIPIFMAGAVHKVYLMCKLDNQGVYSLDPLMETTSVAWFEITNPKKSVIRFDVCQDGYDKSLAQAKSNAEKLTKKYTGRYPLKFEFVENGQACKNNWNVDLPYPANK